jgi:hypothetical protein
MGRFEPICCKIALAEPCGFEAKATAALKEAEDPKMRDATVELAAAAAAAVREGTHLRERGMVGDERKQQGMEDEGQRGGGGSGVTGWKTAAASTQSSLEFGRAREVGKESEADGHVGKQMREVRGWEGAAMWM